MAAQESDRKVLICDRCFASVPPGRGACPECGAPITTSTSESSQNDSLVYTELARANLLRMRGDFKGAESECLKILRRLPNNASAHTLMGDIFLERGDLEQAIQWFELSLDLANDPAVKDKLTSAQKRVLEREQVTAAKELGLPAQPASKVRFVLAVLIPVFAVAIASYIVGKSQAVTPPAPSQQVVGETTAPLGTGKGTVKGNYKVPESASDMALLERLKSSLGDGSRILMAFEDPRTKGMTLIFDTESETDVRGLGARLGSGALESVADALVITLRGMRGGNLIYTSELLRSRLNETKQSSWIAENRSNPVAWIDYVLTNEWTNIQRKTTSTSSGGILPEGSDPSDLPPPAANSADKGKAETKAATDGGSAPAAGSTSGTQTPSTPADTPG